MLWPAVVHPTWWLWKPGAPHSDLAVTHWPNAHVTRRALWEQGRFPLWRSTIMSGTPFAANPLAGLYYPLNWPLLFVPWLPLETGFNLSALIHLWMAGAAMYALMRHGLGVGVWGALVAAVAYEASPKLMAHLGAGHVGWVQAWAWLPLVVLCVWQGCKWASGQEAGGKRQEARCRMQDTRVRWRFAILGGAALAMQFCADVRMAAYTLVAAVTLMLASAVRHPSFVIHHSSFAIRSLAVFLGLSACQWLPTLALMPATTRSAMTLHDAAIWSLPWRYLIGLLLADHGGFHEWLTYLGVSTLAFAWFGARSTWRDRGRRWIVAWLVGLAAFAAWFSLGENGGLFQVLWRVVPGLGLLRVPPRAWALVTFALAALAGLGADAISGMQDARGRMRRCMKRRLTVAVAALPPMLVAGYWLMVGRPPLNLVTFGAVTPLAITLLRARHASRTTPWLGLAVVLLVALDLLIVDLTLVEARSSEAVFAHGQAAAEWLSEQPGDFRVYSPSYSIPQHVAERHGLALADGVDPLQLRAYADYLTRAAGLEPQGYSVTLPPLPSGADVDAALKDVRPETEMLGQLGVRYLAAAFPLEGALQLEGVLDGVYVYRNEGAQPLADDGSDGAIVLADGTILFWYRPWSVYAGWLVSSATIIALLISWSMSWLQRQQPDD